VNVSIARVLRPDVDLDVRLLPVKKVSRRIRAGLGLVWMLPGSNVPRVQGNLNPFGCTLDRNRVLEDRRTCLSSTGLVDLDLDAHRVDLDLGARC
jgi:hypothetical protein